MQEQTKKTKVGRRAHTIGWERLMGEARMRHPLPDVCKDKRWMSEPCESAGMVQL